MIHIVHVAVSLLAKPTLAVPQGVATGSAEVFLTTILNTVYFFAAVAAVIAIVMGGFWYVTGGDNPQQVQKGKNAIIYASIGLIVVFFAFGITGFVAGRFK